MDLVHVCSVTFSLCWCAFKRKNNISENADQINPKAVWKDIKVITISKSEEVTLFQILIFEKVVILVTPRGSRKCYMFTLSRIKMRTIYKYLPEINFEERKCK